MWAQLITMQVKPGKQDDVRAIAEHLQAIEQPDSGLLQSIAMTDQSDPTRVYFLVVFESEEKARARENDPRRADGLQELQAKMEGLVDGHREFVNLDVTFSS